MKKWKDSQNMRYILSKTKAQKLFRYLETQLDDTPCNHTLCNTEQWLKDNLSEEKVKSIINKMISKIGAAIVTVTVLFLQYA